MAGLRGTGPRVALLLALAARGGSRIITIALETLMNGLDYAMAPRAAVDAPRFHHQ